MTMIGRPRGMGTGLPPALGGRQDARMRHVSDDERRARLAVRHALAPASRLDSPEEIAGAMTVLHATEPATVYLSCWARGRSTQIADVDRALYRDRSLVKQLAMRRTLFVFPRDLLAATWGSASARVAGVQRTRMAKDLVDAGLARDGEQWLERARAEVLSVLAEHPDGLLAFELRKLVATIAVNVHPPAGDPWSAARVLTYLGARGDIVRATNAADWRTARPRWTLTRNWLGDGARPCAAADGYRALVRRWLRTFGPGTEDDLVWWLGATKTAVRAALAELVAVEVSLDHGVNGWLAPDDLQEAPDPGPWVALLPVLDPTVMGWHARDFHLDRHRDQLFDTRGNAGTTAWVDGRVVGCWAQDGAGVVALRLLERVSARERRALRSEASRLTAWLGGVRIPTGLRSPAMSSDPFTDRSA